MPDFVGFDEGMQQVSDSGWPSTVTFDLSTKPCSGAGAHTEADTYAGGYGVVTGTGYSAKTQAEPAATALGSKAFGQSTWNTGAATDWPAGVRSIVARDASTGKLICAWNLISGGVARDMSQASTTLNVTPTYAPTNP